MDDKPLQIGDLGLPLRAENALRKNGVTTISGLMSLDDDVLMEMPGLGATCVAAIREAIDNYMDNEIKKAMEAYDGQSINGNTKHKMSVGEYLESSSKNDRNIQIILDYYAKNPKPTLNDLGEKYGITRERARQIIVNGLKKLRQAVSIGKIDSSCVQSIKEAAEKKTEISMVDVNDAVLGKMGLIKVVAAMYDDEIAIIKNRKIYGEWLARKEDNLSKMIDFLSNMLYNRDFPVKIEDVLMIFPVSEELLLSIVNVVEIDGYVTLSTNKAACGTGRLQIISNYIKEVGRPVSAAELIKHTDLSMNQIRGGFCNQNYFVNVGRSVYDLADADYEDLTVSELTRNILTAENRAMKLPSIIKYVQRYRKLTSREIIEELLYSDNPVVYQEGNYVLLSEWGLDKIEKPVERDYAVKLEDAIMEIVPNMEDIFTAGQVAVGLREKYGDNVSTNLNSIKMTLRNLARHEKIAHIGRNTGCYRRSRIAK